MKEKRVKVSLKKRQETRWTKTSLMTTTERPSVTAAERHDSTVGASWVRCV